MSLNEVVYAEIYDVCKFLWLRKYRKYLVIIDVWEYMVIIDVWEYNSWMKYNS